MRKKAKRRFDVAVCVDGAKTLGRATFQGVLGYMRRACCEWVLRGSAGNRLWLPAEVDNIPAGELDGIISFALSKAALAKLKKSGVRVVCIFNDPPDRSIPSVISDNEAIGRLAAGHLLEKNVKKFAYYGTDLVVNSEARFEGFAAFLAGGSADGPDGFRLRSSSYAGHVARKRCRLKAVSPFRWDGRAGPPDPPGGAGYAPAHLHAGLEDVMPASAEARRKSILRLGAELWRLTNDGRDALGVFAYSDSMGVTVIEACREVGLAVPGKVAVIAVATDEIVCELSDPALTTVLQDARMIGQEAAATLDALLRGERPERRRVVVPPLGVSVRFSTDIVASDDPYVTKAVRLIHESFRDKLAVDEICAKLNVSRRVLEERFRRVLGRAPYEEVIRTRIRHAENLLTQTTDTNLAISMESGFRSERRFAGSFKKVTGLSPGQYRKKFADDTPLRPGGLAPLR